MKFPGFLKEDGSIGFVAPSFGCNIEPYKSAFDNAVKKFQVLGHKTVLGPNCYAGSGIGISNTPQACAAELMEAYASEDSDVLISCGGGELMCEVVSHLDFDQIAAAKPKWYLGYSDNTNFAVLSATLCDTAAIYGPCAPAFGMEPWHPAIRDAYELLRGQKQIMQGYELYETEGLKDEEHPLEPYHVTEACKRKAYLPACDAGGNGRLPGVMAAEEDAAEKDTKLTATGNPENALLLKEAEVPDIHVEGRLIGGCLDVLVTLLGTRFDKVKEFNERYAEDGILWFFESCDLNVMSIRRAVWQMKEAGWLDHVKGFLIGRPYVHGQELMGLDQYRAVTDLLAEYQVPVIMDLDIGHFPPMMPLVVGSYAKAKLKGNDFQITMEYR